MSNGLSNGFGYTHGQGGRPVIPAREPLLSNDVLMPAASAFVAAEPCAPLEVTRGTALRAAGASPMTVECADGERLAAIDADWRDLMARAAEPNVFMHPAAMQMAERHLRDRTCITLLAWQRSAGQAKLAGLWAFSVGQLWHSSLGVLKAPPFPHAYLATPVTDRALADAALNAMLDYIAHDARLPKTLVLDAIATDGPTMQALTRVLQARASVPCVLAQARRPMLVSKLDGKQYLEQALSASSRKKLRQHRRRLEEKGALESRIGATPDAVRGAFDEFLTLEAAGWKGRRGSALSCNEAEAAFARGMVAALAARGEAAVHGLYLSGKPVSLQVVLRAGSTAFTWKTAYDESLGDFSPGMLLLEDYTKAFLADDGIACVNSCAYDESGFMSSWSERQTIAQVWLDARRGGALSFVVLSRMQKAYLRLRAMAKQAYLAGRRSWTTH
jgi:CelD/BcsL family acetyltransferase involved in cellulose biosynthesis